MKTIQDVKNTFGIVLPEIEKPDNDGEQDEDDNENGGKVILSFINQTLDGTTEPSSLVIQFFVDAKGKKRKKEKERERKRKKEIN